VHGYTTTSPCKTRTEYFIFNILHTVLYILTYWFETFFF